MSGPTIGMQEIAKDFRAHGVKIAQAALYERAKNRAYPWVSDVVLSKTGRAHVVVWRKDYEDWAREYLYPYSAGKGVTT